MVRTLIGNGNHPSPKPTNEAVPLEQVPNLTSIIVTDNHGKKVRRLIIPRFMGFYRVFNERKSMGEQTPLFGQVDLPVNESIAYSVNATDRPRDILDNPSLLLKFDRNLFSGLELRGLENVELLLGEKPTPDAESFLRIALKWPNLKGLWFRNLTLDKNPLILMNDIKKLAILDLIDCRFDSANLSKQPFLLRISSLNLHGANDTDQILHSLAASTNLERLDLDKCKGVSAAGLRQLAVCPRLKNLQIDSIDRKMIEAIGTLKSVAILKICRPVESAEEIEELRKMPNLNWITLNGIRMSNQDKEKWRQRDKRIVFEDKANDR